MSDPDPPADDAGHLIVHMDDRAVLEVGLGTDDDGSHVAAEHGAVPDAGILAEGHVAHHGRARSDERGRMDPGGHLGAGGNSIWVQASTGAPSLSAGCQVRLHTKFRTARSNVESFDGRSRATSTVRPSVETLTQSRDGRGVSVTSSGTCTKGGLAGFGRSSKQEPSEL